MSQAEIDAITESGGPKPQFAGNEVLKATDLNLATRHWVTTEVPGDHLGNDGDIAFVAGDSVGVDGGASKWGDWTIVDAPDEQNTWTAPDSQGRIWKYVAFNTAGDYTINLTGGMYWVLTVGGGHGGTSQTSSTHRRQGQPGLVNEGYWEFPSDSSTRITVGDVGWNDTNIAKPSSIGSYGTQGHVTWGECNGGRGNTGVTQNDITGYKSFITGKEEEYAPGCYGPARPGRPGRDAERFELPGCVIIATVDEDKTDYYPPGALPGIGGWATITEVSGTSNPRYEYKDANGVDWVAYEWTDDGELKTLNGGLVDLFMISGGAGAPVSNVGMGLCGGGGRVIQGLIELSDASPQITVGYGGKTNINGTGIPGGEPALYGGESKIGSLGTGKSACGTGSGGTDTEKKTGFTSYILGPSGEVFGELNNAPRANRGDSQDPSGSTNHATDGCVIVRVPAANAQNATVNFFRWISYATVENGVVTKVTKTPDNKPYTASAQEVECDASVQEGYLYENGEFTAPEPDYSEEIEALTARLEELRNV